jgi:L-ascorbate 6-phosphate lactonase
MSLMREIREFPVERDSVVLWWLGQNGFLFKTHEGTVLATDLYLSNSCAALAPDGMNFNRRVPVLMPPEEVDVDLYCCTHNHQDHTDPETIGRLRNKDTTHFIGPHPSCEVFSRQGIESGRIVPAWPDHRIELRDIVITGAFALPTDDTDLNHLGFIIQFGHGPRLYMTGDTDQSSLLASAARHSPHLMIACINGGFNNLSHDEAAQLAGQIRPRAAIPCHYDMFPDNSADPRQFQAALKLRAPGVHYLQPEHGKPVVFAL